VFIDPENCWSNIGYYITTSEYTSSKAGSKTVYSLSGSVVLTDCSHKIDWCFSASDGNLEKIDTAIAMLQEFRKKYADTLKVIEKLNK
jgi:hypothetical protein